MNFTAFKISNYKAFKGENVLLFGIPVIGKPGSGITYILGANNAGKTTIVEGLSVRNGRNIKGSERVSGADPEFTLYEGQTVVRKCSLIRTESSTIKEEPVLNDQNTFEIVSSRRHWEPTAHSSHGRIGQTIGQSYEIANRQSRLDVASELRTIEADGSRYNEFVSLMQQVIPEFTKFAVGYEDNHFIEYVSKSGVRHKADLLGDGVITVIRILLHLFVQRPNAIVIDEPELSLHPAAQRKLLEVIASHAERRQIVICTHSPYMVNWQYFRNGAICNRVVKEEDTSSKIYSLTDHGKYEKLLAAGNWQTPFAMDEVAKEIFFMSDGVLFLEGQEDVGLLKPEPLLREINIFGYGVRGKDNFQFAFTLAKDLGYHKVACILDAGENETKIRASLESAFPHYTVVQWDRNDIRDKTAHTSADKTGYFTKDGKKKDALNLGDFELKLALTAKNLK